MPLHLLFPLFSSVVFVLGMMFARQAISRGASSWSGTFLANLWLGLSWFAVELWQPGVLPLAGWWQAALVGLSFVLGQMFTYIAFRYGDVSVATPVFGVKVIIVAVMLACLADEQIPPRVWLGAMLATIGVGVIQAGAQCGVTGAHRAQGSADDHSGITRCRLVVAVRCRPANLGQELGCCPLSAADVHHHGILVLWFSAVGGPPCAAQAVGSTASARDRYGVDGCAGNEYVMVAQPLWGRNKDQYCVCASWPVGSVAGVEPCPAVWRGGGWVFQTHHAVASGWCVAADGVCGRGNWGWILSG